MPSEKLTKEWVTEYAGFGRFCSTHATQMVAEQNKQEERQRLKEVARG